MLTPPSDPAVDADATRRAFLKKVAIGGAVAAIGTQVLPIRALAQEDQGGDADDGADNEDDATTETTEAGTEGESETEPELTPDEQRVTFLAGIGLAAAVAYRAATGDEETEEPEEDSEEPTTTAATSSTTTTLPPISVPPLAEPVVEVLRVFGSHHSQQATALGGLLAEMVTAPNGTLVAEVRGAIGEAGDEAAVLGILRDLEERIAATHLQAIADMEDVNDAKLVAPALPIVGQHALVLGRIGSTPTPLEELVPEAQTTEGALDEGTYPSDGTTAPQDVPGQTDDDANAGGEGAEEGGDSPGGTGTPDDGTESSGGGATGGSSETGGGSAADPESEG